MWVLEDSHHSCSPMGCSLSGHITTSKPGLLASGVVRERKSLSLPQGVHRFVV